MKKTATYVVSFICTFAIAGLGAVVTYLCMDGYRAVNKPPLTPPEWLFPVVWTILFALMAIAAARVFIKNRENSRMPLLINTAQLAANFLWCVFFFGMGAYLFSFLWLLMLIVLVILTSVTYYRIDKPAGIMLVPYIVWLSFAAYLNLAIYIVNM